VFKKRVLRRIFQSKRKEITGGCRKVNNEELHDLYSLPKLMVIKSMMRWKGHTACFGADENCI
jgi:hypothetical protein